MFILACVVLVLITAMMLIVPWVRQANSTAVAASALNTRLRSEQRQELDDRLAQGLLEQETYDQLCLELDKRLLEDMGSIESQAAKPQQASPLPIAGAVVFVTVCTVVMYARLGQHKEQALSERFKVIVNTQSPDVSQALSLYQDIAAYATPAATDNIEWLYMAAQGYTQIGHFRQASELYDRMIVVAGNEPQLLVSAAKAHYLANNRRLNDASQSYLDRALAHNPHQQNALSFAGMAAFENGQFSKAADYWQQALNSTPADQRDGNVLQGALAEAKRRSSLEGVETPIAETKADDIASARVINIALRVGDNIAVSPNKTVFVLARAKDGPPMPLAAKRLRVSDLPQQLTLGVSDAMAPAFSLDSFDEIVVTARISQTGNAMTQSGDIGTNEVLVTLGKGPVDVELQLDRLIP